MTKRISILAAACAAALAVAGLAPATPPNSPSLDGTVNEGSEWTPDEAVAVQSMDIGSDFGAGARMETLYVTWDALNLYVGVAGNFSSAGNDGVVMLIDTTPGAVGNPGPSNSAALTDTGGASNAAISNSNISFPGNFRPVIGAAAFFNTAIRSKVSGQASSSDIAIYNIIDGSSFTEGSLQGQFVVGNMDGGADDFELQIPWVDLYGGPPPPNSEIGLLGFVNSTSGFTSSIFLPALTGTPPINNLGGNNVSLLTDPGLSGFVRVPITDGAGSLLTAVTPTLDSDTGPLMVDVNFATQIFDTDFIEVGFSSNELDANAETPGNYAILDNADNPLGPNVTSASIGLNSAADRVYLQLDAPIAQGTAYKVAVSNVTASGGVATLDNTEASNTGFRGVAYALDASGTNEPAFAVNLTPFIRGEWDGFSGRTPLSDGDDVYPNIPGVQSHDTTASDGVYEGVILVTSGFAADHEYIINAEIDNTPGSDGDTNGDLPGAQQFVGVGYYIEDDNADDVVDNLVLLGTDTMVTYADPISNRRLNQDVTVTFNVLFPSSFASEAQLAGSTVRLQGGTGLGGFSPENIVAPLVTGGADKGVVMTQSASDMTGVTYTADVTFPAGELDVTEFRIVIQDTGGLLGGDFFEQDGNTAPPGGSPPLGSVHLHTMRITEGDRVTPNHQDITVAVSSYDVPALTNDPTPAEAWDMFE